MTLTLPAHDRQAGKHVVGSEHLVDVPPAVLSCRLHEAIAAAGAGSLVVAELGRRATEPALARILSCAAASAASRGIGFTVR